MKMEVDFAKGGLAMTITLAVELETICTAL